MSEALIFWNLLRTTGIEIGLNRGPEGDRPHLQAWSDAGIDMADRLAAHMTRVGRMRWAVAPSAINVTWVRRTILRGRIRTKSGTARPRSPQPP